MPEIVRYNPDRIIVVATNPVDVLTYVAWKLSNLPAQRVIGSATILDTARFRYLLSQHFRIDPCSVHAHIIGEHGDSEVPVWSLANIAGMQLAAFCTAHGMTYDQAAMDAIFCQTRDAAYEILQRIGTTHYMVASGLMRLMEAILRDQDTVLPVSSLIQDYHGISDVCLSLPTIVDRVGVERVLHLDLSPHELECLRPSADILNTMLPS